jgi:sulfite exporter TauE/SafE
MTELPLVLLGGLLGSAHCFGMCGGFAVGVGLGASGFAANLWRQLIYTAR